MKRRHRRPRLKGSGASRAAALALAVVLAHPARSQAPERDTTVVPWAALTTRPRLVDSAGAAALWYPAILRETSVAGQVRAVIVIDTLGEPVLQQTRIEASAHDLFSTVLRRAAAHWRFTPAAVSGQPVRAGVPVTVSFTLPDSLDVPWRDVTRLELDSAGLHGSVGWDVVPREITTPRDTADVKWAKLVVLLRLLSLSASTDTLAATCVRWSDRNRDPLPPAMFRRILMQFDAVNADACPRTYWSMTQLRDSLGKPLRRVPKGHVDPLWVAVGTAMPWTRDLYVVPGYVSPPGSTTRYYCEASRDERGRWSATCDLRSSVLY